MIGNKEIERATARLNKLNWLMNSYPRDSHAFMVAEELYTSTVFGAMAPQDYGLITKCLGRKLTNRDFARIIVADRYSRPLSSVLSIPANIIAIIALRKCQRELHLSQAEFAKKYHVPQAKMSKMESGKQKTDIDILQRILHSMHRKLVIE